MFRFKWILFLLLFSVSIFSQSKKNLEQERKRLREEINFVNKLLKQTEKKSKSSTFQIKALKRKIDVRRNLINKISKEINAINKRIDKLTEKSFIIKKDLNILKENYSKTILNTYKSKKYSNISYIMFVISSENILQGYKRVLYIKRLLEIQKKKSEKISIVRGKYLANIKELKDIVSEKKSLISSENSEKNILEREEIEEKNMISEYSKKKKKLSRKLYKIEKQSKKVEVQIKKLIAKEIKKQKLKKKKSTTYNKSLSSISKSFENQKGKLPWPAKNVFLYMGYGKQRDPILKHITRNNPGITLGTKKNAKVYSMFSGEVSSVMIIPGSNLLVIVKHGEYFTSYSNLKDVSVKKGDKISTGKEIGTVFYDSEDKKSLLNISIYKGFNQLNPSNWIYKMK